MIISHSIKMDKRGKVRLTITIAVFSMILFSIIVMGFSFDPEDKRDIGYEFVNNDGVVHMWNTQDDYFLNKSSGIQLTNHYENYWTKNIFCIGYYSGGDWNKISCSDELSNFNKNIHTDNSTYVNATLWKDITYGDYDLRFGVNYYLGLNDENLSVSIYGKNIGIDIPFDLGFAWKIKNVNIPESPNGKSQPYGDSIEINATRYTLNDTFDLTFRNMSRTYYNEELGEDVVYYKSSIRLQDWTEYLRLDWNKNLDYAVRMFGNGNQEDFYVMLMINAGHFNPGQEKQTTLYWIDAEGDYVTTWTISQGRTIGLDCNETTVASMDYLVDEINIYNSTGTYIDKWVPSEGPYQEQTSITFNEDWFWVGNNPEDRMYKYTLGGIYTNENWSTAGAGNADLYGATNNGTTIFTIDNTDLLIYLWEDDGTAVGTYDISGETTNPRGITTNGEYIWVTDFTIDVVIKYTMLGVYTNENWSIGTETISGERICVNKNFFYVDDNTPHDITLYEGPASMPPAVTINTPLNQTYTTNSITFNVTAVDETAMSGCRVSLDSDATNVLMTNASTSPTYWNATISSIAQGSHTSTFFCNDTYNNINNSENVTFFINTPLTIPNLLLPSNGSGHEMYSTINFVWSNSTDLGGDTITYDLEIYNESDMLAANLIHSNTSIIEGVSNTSISIKLSDYTTQDDDYYWRVRANDSNSGSDWSEVRHFQYANWTITFNLTDAGTGVQIDTSGQQDDFDISCDNGFSATDVNNNYTINDFGVGIIECTFSDVKAADNIKYFDKTQNITANNDSIVEISMSQENYLTQEEHTWLEAIYNCISGGDCAMYNLLLEVNNTVGNIWQHTAPTDESVVLDETITNKVVDASNNLTIDYQVYIPIKAGYGGGDYSPVRIGYWFMNNDNTTCYNQGDKPTGVSDPYCQPLIIETIGPMGGTVNFTVELQPALVSGSNYSIKRIIDIDPLGVWYNYGSEVISNLVMMETFSTYGANVKNTGEVMPSSSDDNSGGGDSSSSSDSGSSKKKTTNVYNTYNTINEQQTSSEDGVIHLNKPGITGGVIGTGLFSGGIFVIILGIFAGLFIVIVISRTILKLKGNK